MWKFVRFFRLKIAHVDVCDVDVCIISVKVFRKQDLTKQQIRAAACEIRKMPRASEKNYYEEEHHLRRAFHYRVRVTQ